MVSGGVVSGEWRVAGWCAVRGGRRGAYYVGICDVRVAVIMVTLNRHSTNAPPLLSAATSLNTHWCGLPRSTRTMAGGGIPNTMHPWCDDGEVLGVRCEFCGVALAGIVSRFWDHGRIGRPN